MNQWLRTVRGGMQTLLTCFRRLRPRDLKGQTPIIQGFLNEVDGRVKSRTKQAISILLSYHICKTGFLCCDALNRDFIQNQKYQNMMQ